jgi:hypothetical protein
VGARSHKNQFIVALKSFTHEKASFPALANALGPNWTVERVRARAEEFDADDSTHISVVKGGVQYFGSETGEKPGLYKEVRRGIEKRWGADNSMRRINVLHTSRTSIRGSGSWTQPDLVAKVVRKSTARPRDVYLAFEVEQAGGFDIESVYQAYEIGRGADFSWVFYAGPACSGTKMRRIEIAAKDLGVGIVHASKPTAPAAWKTIVPARIRDRTKQEQDDFFARSGLTPESFEEL